MVIMASTVTCICYASPSPSPSSSSNTILKPTIFNTLYSSSSPPTFHSKASRLDLYALFPPKGLGGQFSPWSGLKHLGISVTWKSSKLEKRECRNRVAYASLFGVGAPEALVIGVVALLVFGPKGLAEVARSLGKTLRAFQPTIKELQEVSREFKSTLEKEIGLDELSSSTSNPRQQYYNPTSSTTSSSPVTDAQESKIAAEPNGTSSPDGAYTTEQLLQVTEVQLKASAAQQQGQNSPPSESKLETQDSMSEEPNLGNSDSEVQEKKQISSPASTTAKENSS